MRSSRLGTRQREGLGQCLSGGEVPGAAPCLRMGSINDASEASLPADYSVVQAGDSARISLMLTPKGRGPLCEQVDELLSTVREVLQKQARPMEVISHTVFLRDPGDRLECEQLFLAHYGLTAPVLSFVLQPPCCGAALTLEALAIGGASVAVERFGPHALAVSYDGLRWVYCAGIRSDNIVQGGYRLTIEVLERMGAALRKAGTGFENVVRTWFYLSDITECDGEIQRYKELNRARTDFYRGIRFCRSLSEPMIPHGIYPASTGIGMKGMGMVASCLSLQTERKDAVLIPLENPQQTPAYAYPHSYSPQSPKFSRGMALVLGEYTTTWVSGTASVVNAQSRHTEEIDKQTEQTIDNVERLIASENFAFHGMKGVGATLNDLAKIRVYLKRPADFARCKSICDRRLGCVPAIYAIADICRPELLVEIEGVAFSMNRRHAERNPMQPV